MTNCGQCGKELPKVYFCGDKCRMAHKRGSVRNPNKEEDTVRKTNKVVAIGNTPAEVEEVLPKAPTGFCGPHNRVDCWICHSVV